MDGNRFGLVDEPKPSVEEGGALGSNNQYPIFEGPISCMDISIVGGTQVYPSSLLDFVEFMFIFKVLRWTKKHNLGGRYNPTHEGSIIKKTKKDEGRR